MKKYCSQCKTETTHKTTTIRVEKGGKKVKIIRYMCTKCGKSTDVTIKEQDRSIGFQFFDSMVRNVRELRQAILKSRGR